MTAEEHLAIRARAARGDFDSLPVVEVRMWADNVLVLMDWLAYPRTETVTPGGIVIPRSADKPANDAAVEAAVLDAPEFYWVEKHTQADRKRNQVREQKTIATRLRSEVRRGDRVLVDRADQGDVYELPDGREARIIRQHNVIGVLEGDAAAE